jgi:molybdate transport system substrate-binding protein
MALAAPGAAGEIVVGAAASVRETALAIAHSYEARHPGTRVRTSFAASSWLAAQVRAGAPIAVLISADERIVDELAADGFVAEGGRIELARNRLVVVARPGIAGSLRRGSDLAGPGVRRVAMPESAVPVGRYARGWLEARGLIERIAPKLVPTEHARATLAAVDLGHADAAIVYATDARMARSAVVAFKLPAAEQPRIVYAAARIAGTGTEAERLLAFLADDEALRILAHAGFRPARDRGP